MNGARSSVEMLKLLLEPDRHLCTYKNLGVIIIDEEHEASYKQDSNPVTMLEVAILRAQYNQRPWSWFGNTELREPCAGWKRCLPTPV